MASESGEAAEVVSADEGPRPLVPEPAGQLAERALEPMVAPYHLTLGDALVASGELSRAIAVYQ